MIGTSLPILDRALRPLRKLRLSVTDRCNLRCSYCMPEESYVWLEKKRILRFEECERLISIFVRLGAEQVRLTGGEPLLRRDLPELVRQIKSNEGVRDLALTTNAVRLRETATDLLAAGLDRVTISLDTLDRERFLEMTRSDELDAVLDGIVAAREVGFLGTKLNMVVMRGVNDDEILPMVEFARAQECEVRFIEYMDVGGATGWSMDQVVSRAEILARLGSAHGAAEAVPTTDPSAPADRFRLPDGTVFGIIASTTSPFCGSCDRSRITADGHWYTCLYAGQGLDLARPLRAGATDEELAALIQGAWRGRDDRGAEERLSEQRVPMKRSELRDNPHLEMHTRGG